MLTAKDKVGNLFIYPMVFIRDPIFRLRTGETGGTALDMGWGQGKGIRGRSIDQKSRGFKIVG